MISAAVGQNVLELNETDESQQGELHWRRYLVQAVLAFERRSIAVADAFADDLNAVEQNDHLRTKSVVNKRITQSTLAFKEAS